MAGGVYPPISVAKSWPKPNYVDPELRGWDVVILVVVFYSLTLLVFVARIWARFRISKNAGLDDALISVAMIFLTGLAISTCLADRLYGFDRHVWDLLPGQGVMSRKIVIAIEFFYTPGTGLTKISILCFYRRMSAGSISKPFYYAVWGSIIFVILYMIIFTINIFVTCIPMHAFWHATNPKWALEHAGEFHCFNEGANVLAASAVSVIQDFIACGLPLILFWDLQLPRRQKIALASIFGLGFFLCITGVLRIIAIAHIYFGTYDVTWAAYHAWVWTAVEAHLAIICASAPALKVFFKKYLQVSSFGSGFRSTMKRSMGHPGTDRRTGDVSYGISSTAGKGTYPYGSQLKSVSDDVEMGAIKVARDVDVQVESRSDSQSDFGVSGRSSQEHLKPTMKTTVTPAPDFRPPPSSRRTPSLSRRTGRGDDGAADDGRLRRERDAGTLNPFGSETRQDWQS